MRPHGIVGGNGQIALKLPYHASDRLEPQAGVRLIGVEAVGKANALVGNLYTMMSVDFPRADLDNAITVRVGVFHRVCDELADKKPHWNCMVSR